MMEKDLFLNVWLVTLFFVVIILTQWFPINWLTITATYTIILFWKFVVSMFIELWMKISIIYMLLEISIKRKG